MDVNAKGEQGLWDRQERKQGQGPEMRESEKEKVYLECKAEEL